MSRRRPPALKLLTIAIMAVLPVLAAHAEPQSQDQRGRNSQRDGRQQDSRGEQGDSSLSDAVRRVERDTRGEVLSAERVQYDGRDMHRVKVVDDQGRVRVFMQDPRRDENDDEASSSRGDKRGAGRRPPPARGDDD